MCSHHLFNIRNSCRLNNQKYIHRLTDSVLSLPWDQSVTLKFLWPRNILWMETLERNTLIFRNIAPFGFLDTFFFHFSLLGVLFLLKLLCWVPFLLPCNGRFPLYPHPPPWFLCSWGGSSRNPLFRTGESRLQPDAWAWTCTFHSIAMWPRATYVALLGLGLYISKMEIMVSYRVAMKITCVNKKYLQSCLVHSKFSVIFMTFYYYFRPLLSLDILSDHHGWHIWML